MDAETAPVEKKYISFDQLRKQRQALERELQAFPPQDERSALICEYQVLILDLQIECEQRRRDLRTHTMMYRKRISKVVKDGLEIETSKSFFGWEKIDKPYLQLIDKKETEGIEYFTDLINKARNEQTAIPIG
ncbi:MAG TPA: hypothetical protein VGN64_17015 [Dyadobacter sp.]|nr:hypothetical protein [Dyadobacter sp.]